MKYIIIILISLFITLPSLANIGDVYYCETTNVIRIDLNHKFNNYTDAKFKFKREKDGITTKGELFDKEPWFTPLDPGNSMCYGNSNSDQFCFNSMFYTFFYEGGNFTIKNILLGLPYLLITGKCEIF